MDYVERDLKAKLSLAIKTFPIVMIIGPRQSGKSTFAGHELPDFLHLDLERPSDNRQVTTDLELFFKEHPGRVCIDEAQRCPELFPVLRSVSDSGPGCGRFVILGSAGPSLFRTAAETLTGRIGILTLTPFTARELSGIRPWQERWMWGGLPPIHALASAEQKLAWIESYVLSVLERDLPLLGVRVPSVRLMRFWTMLTHLQGGMLNVSALAESMEMSTNSVSRYLDILEGALMIQRLPPFFANLGKRLVKRPKLYIRDTGILHWLAGIHRPEALETWTGRGASFESLVVGELTARAELECNAPRFSFYRTQAGAEVDLLVETGGGIIAVEVKHGVEVGGHDTAGLRQCMKDLDLEKGFIVTRGNSVRRLGAGIISLPWEGIVTGEIAPWRMGASG
jgi:predicted AAA+ superfamily ATPase